MSRRPDIDMAKGLVILTVVFGHLVARTDPAGVTWYEPLRRAVYAFHMPFFLYLSGMVAMLSGTLLMPANQWRHLLRARSIRLLVPFFGLGLLVIAGKITAQNFIYVDHPPANFSSGVLALFWHTSESPALFIWYLFVLFFLTVVFSLLVAGKAERLPLLCAGAAILYTCNLPGYFYLDHIGRYAIFFVLGACAGNWPQAWMHLVERSWQLFLCLLVACCAMVAAWGAAWPVWLILLPVGVISMPALHGLVIHCPIRLQRILLVLGRYTLVIYLFNTMFIGLAKGVLLRVYPWSAPHFGAFAIVLMFAGILGPISLKRYLFRYAGALDRLTS